MSLSLFYAILPRWYYAIVIVMPWRYDDITLIIAVYIFKLRLALFYYFATAWAFRHHFQPLRFSPTANFRYFAVFDIAVTRALTSSLFDWLYCWILILSHGTQYSPLFRQCAYWLKWSVSAAILLIPRIWRFLHCFQVSSFIASPAWYLHYRAASATRRLMLLMFIGFIIIST